MNCFFFSYIFLFALRPKKNTRVSTNPTDPTFRADYAMFIAILKKKK